MDALLRSQDTNHIHYFSMLARLAEGGDAEAWDGVALATTGAPVADFNTAFVTGLPASQDTYAEVIRRLRASGPFTLQVPDEFVDRVGPELETRGLREVYRTPGMRHRVVRHTDAVLPDGLDVLTVSSLHDHVRFVDTAAAGFGLEVDDVLPAQPPQLLRERGYVELLGLVSGEAVGTACAVRSDDTVGVYAVAVPPPYRRQGVGRALTAAAVAWGTAAGATTAVLQASPEAEPLYRAMGFRTVRTYHRFADADA